LPAEMGINRGIITPIIREINEKTLMKVFINPEHKIEVDD